MRWVVGLLLIAAALLKALEFYQHPANVLTDSFSRFLMPLLVGCELGLGLAAIGGLFWRQLRPLATLLFAGFACYSLLLALQGAASCGCFGPLEINPWWTFLLDLIVFAGLVLECFMKGKNKDAFDGPTRPQKRIHLVGTAMLSLAMAFGLGWHVAPRQTFAEDRFQTVGDLVILEPETWIGKKFPLLEHIDIDLSQGNWVILLYHHDCPKCQEALPRYERLARHSDGRQVALIEVPPYGERSIPSNPVGKSIHGRLSDAREWFVQTPVEMVVENGVVKRVSGELPDLGDGDGHNAVSENRKRDSRKSFMKHSLKRLF